MKKCEICNAEFSNLISHVRMKHQMSMEDYGKQILINNSEMNYSSDDVFDDDTTPKNSISKKEINNRIFNVDTLDPDRPLSEFLLQIGMDEKELREVVKAYKKDSNVSVTASLKNNFNKASADALEFKDKTDAKVHNVYLAETLVDKYGFKVLRVISGPPKTWVLKKI